MENEDFVQCGQSIAKLEPSCELRFSTRKGYPPILQQKWVARAKMQDGGEWEEHRWRNVPFVGDGQCTKDAEK